MINIDELISQAAKGKTPSLPVYRLIKDAFLRWTKDNPGRDLDEPTQIKILKKMYDQRMESKEIFEKNGRKDLADKEMAEIEIISPFLPKEASPEEIEAYTRTIIDTEFGGAVSMKDTGSILAKVQEQYPGASGKIVSTIVRSYC